MNHGYFYAIGAAVMWGLVYAIDEKILVRLRPLTLLFINQIVAVLILLPFVFLKRHEIKTDIITALVNPWMLIGSIVLATIAGFFILAGIKNLNASIASIIEIAYPFFVVLFSYILFRSAPNMYFYVGGLLIFIGTFIIIRFA